MRASLTTTSTLWRKDFTSLFGSAGCRDSSLKARHSEDCSDDRGLRFQTSEIRVCWSRGGCNGLRMAQCRRTAIIASIGIQGAAILMLARAMHRLPKRTRVKAVDRSRNTGSSQEKEDTRPPARAPVALSRCAVRTPLRAGAQKICLVKIGSCAIPQHCVRSIERHQYGAAHRTFIIVSLVCGFFVDIINALIIPGSISALS